MPCDALLPTEQCCFIAYIFVSTRQIKIIIICTVPEKHHSFWEEVVENQVQSKKKCLYGVSGTALGKTFFEYHE